MNFKTECLTFELDKSQSEILIENEVNELFDFVDLEADMTVEYYNQIVTPYLISLNLNPNEFNGYALYFYDIDNEVCLTKNQTSLDEKIVRIKLNSETLKKTNHFFNNKKYKKVIENISGISTVNLPCRIIFDAKSQYIWKNNLIDTQIEYFIGGCFQNFINIKNQEDLYLQTISKDKMIEVYHGDTFCFNFDYQIATNKKEIIDMLFNLKRQIEYQINIKMFN